MIEAGRLLSLARAAEIVPLSKTTLYRVAERGSGPFYKVEGRWMVYEVELHAWVRSHVTPNGDPMPRPRREDLDNVWAEVHEMRRRNA